MDLREAVDLINKTPGLILEFMKRSLTYFEMQSALKSILPGYDRITDGGGIDNHGLYTKEYGNNKLILLKPDALDKRNMSLREFENKIMPLGWTVSGYTENQIVLVPIHNGTRDVETGKEIRTPRKAENAAVVNAAKGYYFRFSNMPPSEVNRIGFRTTKDRNLDFDNPKRSTKQYWNQERVYCFSIEVLAKRCQGKLDRFINGLYVCVESGYEYGRYLYLFKDTTDKFNADVEYGYNSLSIIAGFLESNINPHNIILSIDTKTVADGAGAIIEELGFDKMAKNGDYKKFLGREPETNSREFPEYDPRVKRERNFSVEQWT